MPRKAKQKQVVAVIDAETDPFKFGRIPKPFAWGFFDGENYVRFWGENSTLELIEYLKTRENLLIYAHNGGKFDFFYLLDWIGNPLKIINGRIVSASLFTHTLRDSYAIMPVSLAGLTGGKLSIDYELMEEGKREAHKNEILEYLRVDCVELHRAVSEFINKFGVQLTIGATAFKSLQSFHPTIHTNKSFDETYRRFYYGGRCQALKTGHIKKRKKVFDVNSMYPGVMKDFLHPNGCEYLTPEPHLRLLDKHGNLATYNKKFPYFIRWRGINKNAVPTRIKEGPSKGGLTFETETGEFFSTSHEIKVAIKYGLIKIDEILELHVPTRVISFGEFVDNWMREKIACEKRGDKIGRMLAKLLSNSGYGKFAQNPENYSEWMICRDGGEIFEAKENGYECFEICGDVSIWRKPVDDAERFNNVAIAASITGASRAVLLEALCNSSNPVYCDTDSIICDDLKGVEIDPLKIGAWKLEAELDEIYIAGKKLYAGFENGKCTKLASKGAKLSGDDIRKIVAGGRVEWQNMAPAFSLSRPIEESQFVSRSISMRR